MAMVREGERAGDALSPANASSQWHRSKAWWRPWAPQSQRTANPGQMLRVFCTALAPSVNYTVVMAQPTQSCQALLRDLCRRYKINADPQRYCLVRARLPRTGHHMEMVVLEPDLCPALLGLDPATFRLEVHRLRSALQEFPRYPAAAGVVRKGRLLDNLLRRQGARQHDCKAEDTTSPAPFGPFLVSLSLNQYTPLHYGIVCIGSDPYLYVLFAPLSAASFAGLLCRSAERNWTALSSIDSISLPLVSVLLLFFVS